jgi:ATP-dependent Clp protease ATP-binding subunit ClpA
VAGHTPAVAESRPALELTFREALRLGHDYIGTEHLVLALLDLEDGVGPLSDCGLAKPDLEQRVVATLAAMTG